MIRVNLLPVRELQAAVIRRRDLTIGGIVLGSVIIVLLATYFLQYYQLSKLGSELEILRSEIQALNVKVKEVGDLQNRIKEYTSKHNIISDLNKKKTGPVGIMESLSAATPTRLWLTEFKETGGRLTINGTAADNQTVAEFLKALAASAYFRDVELVETTQGGQESGPFKKFSIRSAVSYLPAPKPPSPSGGVKETTKEGKRS
jgi:type IV pilus assembly protein PilN